MAGNAVAGVTTFGPQSSTTASAPIISITLNVDTSIGSDATLTVNNAFGDFDLPSENFSVFVDNVQVATGVSPGTQCSTTTNAVATLPQATMAPLIADGVVVVELRATAQVNVNCGGGVTFSITGGSLAFDAAQPSVNVPDLIADFVGARNRQVLAMQANRQRRVGRLGGGAATADAGSGNVTAFGASIDTALPFDASISQDGLSFAMGMVQAFDKEGAWDIWIEGQFSLFEDGNRSDGHFGVVHAGIDFLVTPDLLAGIGVQYDWADQDYSSGATANASIEGMGWMVGPYFSMRVIDNLFVDGRAAWGQASTKIRPLGTFEDEFDSSRWLVSGAVFGNFDFPALNDDYFTVRPTISAQYIQELQDSYLSSGGGTVQDQTIGQGDIRVGPMFGYTRAVGDDLTINPWVEVSGVYAFSDLDRSSQSASARNSHHTSASVSGGFSLYTDGGVNVTLSGRTDGLGSSFLSYGGALNVRVPIY